MTYCFSDLNGGNVFEHQCPMGKAPQALTIAGVMLFRDYAAEQHGHRSGDAWTNYVSISRGVPVSQMEKAEKLDAELGVPTRYEVRGPVGLPRITSKEHDRKWLRAHRWVSHDPGDRYPVPGEWTGR